MKRCLCILLLQCLICSFAASCSRNETPQMDGEKTEAQESMAIIADSNNDNTKIRDEQTSGDVDVDLTVLSSTMVYVEVYNMLTKPNDYIGKTIKMSGPYYTSYYGQTGQYYHYIIIEDATACCQEGLEFKWNGEHTYPDDYPAAQTKIEVVGVFESYEEQGQTYYYLAVDNILII